MITDVSIANDVIYRMLENGDTDADFTLSSPLLTSMFTKQEILDSINRVQQKFLLETGMILTRTTLTAAGGQSRYDLTPTTLNGPDIIRPRRLTWKGPA